MKKIISIILILSVLATMFVLPASASQTEQVIVHYYNEHNWSSPDLYYYMGNSKGQSWPGVPMQEEGKGWYSYTINKFAKARVIFSDNGASQHPGQNQEGLLVEGEKTGNGQINALMK